MPDPDVERAHELAEQARHDSVTPERLTQVDLGFGRNRLHQEPLYHRLLDGEQPHFLFHATRQEPVFNGPSAPDAITRSSRYRVMHLITDRRWLMVAGNKQGDQEQSFELEAITATNFDTSGTITSRFSNNVFAFEIEGAHCTVPLANDYDREDLAQLSRYLRDEFDAVRGGVSVDSDEEGYTVAGNDSIDYDAGDVRSRLDQLPEEAYDRADEQIAAADSAEELIPYLDDLIEEYEESEPSLDDRISDASSVGELRQEVATRGEQVQREAQKRVGNGLREFRRTFRNADEDEVGRYAVGAVRTAVPIARTAPYSTPALLIGALVAGTATGIHASGRDDSPLAEIDPTALAAHVNALTDPEHELEEIDGAVAGTLLGTLTYAGEDLLTEDYARWLTAADPEAVLAGADAGARFAAAQDNHGTRRQGALVGAGTGLLASYVDWDEEQFDDTVDEDLYREYLEECRERGLLSAE
ncbi:MAG: hypothetical protein ABEI98_04975 [Halorhabdus sp.]